MSAPSAIRAAKTTAGGKGAAAEAVAPEKKSKKKMIIIGVLVLVVAFAGYHFTIGAKPTKPGPPVAGVVIALPATTLNLADGHFLKLGMGLETIKGSVGATLDPSNAQDIVISEFTNMTMAQLSTDAERATIKADLLTKIQKAYPKQVMEVFLTSFVMQ